MNTIVQTLAQKREFISGKIIIGIDPAKDKHQVRIINANGLPVGKTSSLKNDFTVHYGNDYATNGLEGPPLGW